MFFKLSILLISIFISANSYTDIKKEDLSKKQCTQEVIEEITTEKLLSPLPDDKLLGNLEAPILMIEYASLTCYHCSLFHRDVFPAIKKKYIDTGKILYIYRHFPLDYRGLKAAMLSFCYKNEEDYFNFNKAVFNSIDLWNYSDLSDLTVLQKIASLSNLKHDIFNRCIDEEKNKEVFNKIINDKSLAINKLGVTATPMFFIKFNNNLYADTNIEHDKIKHEGYRTLEYFTDIIDRLYEKTVK
ncbi:MAG: DsbA family protein [Wolbachia endosymbiont of Menacanthus eurysternus]|nr:MAG: DsbA family protein [Wolbachia endosymbiont of Menacanthus eurysternus]